MRAQDLIRTKRDGGRLTAEQIRALIAGVTDGSLPDYQVAAMLMAVFWRGLDDEELSVWTQAMIDSGTTVEYVAATVASQLIVARLGETLRKKASRVAEAIQR